MLYRKTASRIARRASAFVLNVQQSPYSWLQYSVQPLRLHVLITVRLFGHVHRPSRRRNIVMRAVPAAPVAVMNRMLPFLQSGLRHTGAAGAVSVPEVLPASGR